MARADIMAGRAYVSLYTKNNLLDRGLQSARANLNKFGSEMMALGARIVAVTAAIATPIAFATKTFADFDDAMRAVGAVSQSTTAELQTMTAVAKMLGATTSFTAVQVAQLMTELGRAGFKPDQINAMTGAVMDMARATGTDATLASGIMAASIRQFGLEATDAARVADVLTKAANSTFNTVEGLGESLKYAGPVAKELGLSLEDTVAILGSLGNVGIQGSEAGTALRRLGVISAATGEKLKATFGINNIDAAGNLKPLIQIMDDIGKAVENLPVAEKVQKMNEAFGLLGITSASVLSRAAVDTQKLAAELKNADGTASKAAKNMDAGLGGAFRIAMSAAEGLQIAVGTALSGSLQKVTEAITGILDAATKWVAKNEEMVVLLVSLAAGAISAGVALIGIGVAAKVAAISIGAVTSAIAVVKAGVAIAVTTMTMFGTATVIAASLVEAAWWAMATSSLAASGVSKAAATAIGAAWVAMDAIVAGAGVAYAVAVSLIEAAWFAITTTSVTSAAIASGAMGLFEAAGAVMATGWTAVSGVIAAGWAVIMGPVTPFVIAAGVIVAAVSAIAAAAAYATVKGMDFSAAWTIAKDTLTDLFNIAKRVGGVLMDALGGGDFDIAFRAAMAGIKLVMAAAIEALKKGWDLFWSGALETTKKFFFNFGNIAVKVTSAVARALADPISGATALSDAIKAISSRKFDITFGIDTEGMRTEANAELDKLEKELVDRKAKRDAEIAAKTKQEASAAGAGAAGGAGGEGSASGSATSEQMDGAATAEKVATAFDRETEALQQQIIALKAGEVAAERFRLAKEGLTEAEIDQVMVLRTQQTELEKQREASGRLVDQIRDFADADYEKNKATKGASEAVAKQEKDAIQRNLASGKIDGQTAKEAMAQADIRKAERDHQEKLAAFKGDATFGGQQFGLKQGGASAATFSAQSLLSMGSGAGQGPQVKALIEAKKAITEQTKLQKEQSEAQIAAIKQSKMKHS